MSLSFQQACDVVCAPGTPFEILETDVLGQPTKVFSGTPPNVRALFGRAAEQPREFIVFEDERWTMDQLMQHAGRLGDALANQFGVAKGDRVAILMRNYPEWISAFVAITSIGAIAVPMNGWWKTDEAVFALDNAGVKVVVADPQRMATMQAAAAGAISADIIVVRATDDMTSDAPDGVHRIEDVLTEGTTMPEVDIDPDDDMMILYTSGTTGNPKGAVSTHRAVMSALMAYAARSAAIAIRDASALDPPADVPATKPPAITMLCVPLFHVTGLVSVMLGAFVSGAKLVMTHKWEPNRALELIESERVTNFVGVPTMSFDLLEAETFAERDTSSLKSVAGGGAPMPPELVKRIEDGFPQGRPALGYGMTETNAYGPQNSGDDFVTRPTSTGRTVPVVDIRVTDPAGAVLPTGETGEIWFRGPNLIRGYWNRPDATADAIVDGWLRTGDIGHLDDEGFVYVSDRAKDMVLRGGENIFCAEVEATIYEHPAVYEAAVYGLPHHRLGEELACHVMVKADRALDVDELRAFVGERLADFKVPSTVTIVSDSLPRNASGKILKRTLRDDLIASC